MCDQKFYHVNEQKRTRSIRVTNDATYAFQLKLHEKNEQKSRFEAIVTSYGRNKKLDAAGQVLHYNSRIFID